MPVILVCQYEPCGKSFQVAPHKQATAKYCSDTCRSLGKRNRVTLVCRHCHCSFIVVFARRNKALFCSTQCKHLSERVAVETGICVICENPFPILNPRKNRKKPTCCSRKCGHRHASNLRRNIGLRLFWTKMAKCTHEEWCVYCCFNWQGNHDNHGYGKLTLDHTNKQLAHRIAYELFHGRSLSPEEVIGHYCHNSLCTNPAHLHTGTQADNIADSVRDKRHSFGERNGHHKLIETDIPLVFTRYHRDGMSPKDIAKALGVSASTINDVLNRRTWGHVPISA